MVKQYCAEQNLEYYEFGFIRGNGQVLGVLKDVAEQARIIRMVAREEAKEAVTSS
jgi:delta8-fatty-acid desaturase